MAEASQNWQEHSHEATVHRHGHYHVTHNHREMTGGFEHLSSYHEHEHDHPAISHSHYPHEDFEREHQGEAHVHDHAEAVRPELADGAADGAKRAPTKRASKKVARANSE